MTGHRSGPTAATVSFALLGVAIAAAPAGAGDLYIAGTIGEVYRGDSVAGGFEQFGGICLGPVQELAMDASAVYAGDLNGGVVRFDLETGAYEGIYFAPAGITSMAFHGNDLLTGAADGTIYRLRPTTGEVVGTVQAFAPVDAMLVDGDDLYVTGPEGSLWRGSPMTGDFEYFGCACAGTTQGIGLDATRLHVGDAFGLLLSYDLATGFLVNEGFLPFGVTSLVMDGDVILVSDDAGNVHRVDATSYQVLATLPSPIAINTILMGEGPACPGDTDGSGMVDVNDLVNVILDWGTDGTANGGDADGSGGVDVNDIVAVIANWGTCP